MMLNQANPEDAGDAGRGPSDCPRPRILLAEDDDEMRTLLSQSLCDAGYEVEELANGLELMEHLSSYLVEGSRVDLDLIISDIRMPWVDGLEVLRAIGQCIGYPPVILITAFGDDAVHTEASRLGAAAIMDKPFDVEELLARVREMIRGQRASGPQGTC
jgi:DNA-binding response OmpR family regulator